MSLRGNFIEHIAEGTFNQLSKVKKFASFSALQFRGMGVKEFWQQKTRLIIKLFFHAKSQRLYIATSSEIYPSIVANRVARLGILRYCLHYFGHFFENYRSSPNFCYTFLTVKVLYKS
jgi:hypothetical protein